MFLMPNHTDRALISADSFVTPSESYRILAPPASLRKHLTDSYWCDAMNDVCAGKLDGVAVRFTGHNLVMVQFRPKKLSPGGYRYPLSMSIPAEYLVPLAVINDGLSSALNGTPNRTVVDKPSVCSYFKSSSNSDVMSSTSKDSAYIRLCVVCGRYNIPGMMLRRHGFKCKECVGTKSLAQLRRASARHTSVEEM